MKQSILKLENLIWQTAAFVRTSEQTALRHKPSPEKWSKMEVLGHLIDSAINNLQRFTEIQYEPQPYRIRKYKQDDLVKANQYQTADAEELLRLWLALNQRILRIMENADEAQLALTIMVDETAYDLRFLMVDYVDHMEHHLKQILDKLLEK